MQTNLWQKQASRAVICYHDRWTSSSSEWPPGLRCWCWCLPRMQVTMASPHTHGSSHQHCNTQPADMTRATVRHQRQQWAGNNQHSSSQRRKWQKHFQLSSARLKLKQKSKQVCQLTRLAYIPTWLPPIADHREIQTVYNSGHHRPCGGLFVARHTVRGCPAILWHWADDRRMCYRFFNFWHWGLPMGQSLQKGELTYYPRRSTILQNFSLIVQTVYETCVTKVIPLFGLAGDDLLATQLYHPPEFHRPTSTHAGNTSYQKSCRQTDKQTEKQ